eukprot:TRINITY_DN4768_c0_g1_i1.p1 TRINITY_DN4768_c0_g1~~TRINITY_DN4768_c0_g1_i1.p1  ORF type:complete len:383 (+),score=88.56 TRINITY_DN4768_c0_g1_i1:105-1151(+)
MDPTPPILKCMLFKFDLPQTKKVAFHKLIKTVDTRSNDCLLKASMARDDMCTLLERQESGPSLIQAIEAYLPHLFGLVVAVEGQAHIRLNSPLSFSWTSPLTSHRKSFFTDYTYRYEVIMTLMTYGYVMCNRAHDLMEGVTSGNFDDISKQIAHFLRLASGVFEYITIVELPRWLNLPADRPLETMSPITQALSLMAIAGAEEVAVKKAVINGTSRGVTAKLCADVWKKYETTNYQFNSIAPDAKKHLNKSWKEFLTASSSLQKANTYKFAANAAYEDKKCGVAVGFLNVALKELRLIPNVAGFRAHMEEQRADIEHFFRIHHHTIKLVITSSPSYYHTIIPSYHHHR